MRILAFPGVSGSTVFSLATLLRAAQSAGHEVMVAANPDVVRAAVSIGLPATVVTEMTWQEAVFRGRDGVPLTPPEDLHGRRRYVGRMFARYAAATMLGVGDVLKGWRPDVTVGCPLAFSAALAAAEAGIPYVRQSWDAGDPLGEEEADADDELARELSRLGLRGIPDPDLRIEIAPRSLLSPELPDGSLMRWRPTNTQVSIEPWMYESCVAYPRVLVTSGGMATPDHRADVLYRMVEATAGPRNQVVVATTPDLARRLHDPSRNVLAGWAPLDVVLPTCAVVVHPVGAVTAMSALHAGVPQVVVPEWDILLGTVRSLAERGAARLLPPREGTVEQIRDGCRELLDGQSYRASAAELAREMATAPPPSVAVAEIEALVR